MCSYSRGMKSKTAPKIPVTIHQPRVEAAATERGERDNDSFSPNQGTKPRMDGVFLRVLDRNCLEYVHDPVRSERRENAEYTEELP